MRYTLEQAQEKYSTYTKSFESIILGTASHDGEPLSSYAPFVEDNHKNIYVFVSDMSKHTSNLKKNNKASVLFIQDESKTKQIYARERLNYECKVELIQRDQGQFEELMNLFDQKFGAIMKGLKEMSDFHLFKLIPESGRYVIGFGAAYDIKPDDLNQLVHLRGAGHGHAKGGNPHGNPHAKKEIVVPTEGDLKTRHEKLLENAGGRMFPKEAAKLLGVSELELCMVQDGVTVLKDNPIEILNKMEHLGHVMSMTRSDNAVSEIKGLFPELKWPHGHAVGVSDDQIALRVFPDKIYKILAKDDGDKCNVQFFDQQGEAVYKVFIGKENDKSGFKNLTSEYAVLNQQAIQVLKKEETKLVGAEQVDVSDFQNKWDSLADVHGFMNLVESFNIDRLTALEIAGQSRAKFVEESVEKVLKDLAACDIDLMIFLSNGACIQIFDGKYKNVQTMHGFVIYWIKNLIYI